MKTSPLEQTNPPTQLIMHPLMALCLRHGAAADQTSKKALLHHRGSIYMFGLAALAVLALAAAVRAQLSIPQFTIDGGGGKSTGGVYAVRGTIGQPDAASLLTSPNQQFKLEPGFWSGVNVVQLLGAPLLKIKLIGGGQAILSWPVSATGFTLEETANAATPNSWNTALQPVEDTATEHTVTVSAVGVIKCYRLKRP